MKAAEAKAFGRRLLPQILKESRTLVADCPRLFLVQRVVEGTKDGLQGQFFHRSENSVVSMLIISGVFKETVVIPSHADSHCFGCVQRDGQTREQTYRQSADV